MTTAMLRARGTRRAWTDEADTGVHGKKALVLASRYLEQKGSHDKEERVDDSTVRDNASLDLEMLDVLERGLVLAR